MKLKIAALALLVLLAQGCAAPEQEAERPASGITVGQVLGADIVLASVEAGAAVLGQSDAYTQGMGAHEVSMRIRSIEPATEADYLASGADSVLEWNEEAQEVWAAAAESLGAALEGLELDLPGEILLILTKTDFDVGAPHTRGPGVILPIPPPTEAHNRQTGLLAHEVFHVATRHDPGLRDRLFPLFGYRTIDAVPYPEEIAVKRLSNPDAHEFRHAIRVMTPDGEVDVVTMLSARGTLEEAAETENLFSLLELNLVAIDGSKVYSPDETNFGEVAAINTGYIIHPEEVAADNFALLAMRRAGVEQEVARPELLDELEAALTPGD